MPPGTLFGVVCSSVETIAFTMASSVAEPLETFCSGEADAVVRARSRLLLVLVRLAAQGASDSGAPSLRHRYLAGIWKLPLSVGVGWFGSPKQLAPYPVISDGVSLVEYAPRDWLVLLPSTEDVDPSTTTLRWIEPL